MRIMAASMNPPVKPAIAPQMTPKLVASTATAAPISSELWPPTISRPRMSKPLSSVPSGCPGPGFRLEAARLEATWLVW